MKQSGRIWIVITLIVLTITSTHARAIGGLTFYPLEAEAIVRYFGTDRSDNNGDIYVDTEWRGGIRLAQKGYILDPGIAEFLFEIEPVYIGGKIKTNTNSDDREGSFLSYLIQLNLLRGTQGPFGFNFSALRTTNVNAVALGSRYEDEIEINTASATWRNSAFPIEFRYTERSLKQDFTSGQSNLVTQRDEQLNTLSAQGRNSKMDLLVEHQTMDDRVTTRDNDFDLNRVVFNHRLSWGRNSRLLSRLNYYDRTGFNANERLTLVETAYIQHTENIYSRSIYNFNSVKQFFETTEHELSSELNHQLYSNLTTTARIFANSLSSDDLDESRWRTELEGYYNKQNLVFGANVSLGLAVSYQETDRNSSFGLAEVIDEVHKVPLGGMIILNRRFILEATIIVTSSDGAVVYTDGMDYLIFEQTDDLTQLQTIPGGRIASGDTILVSYKSRVLPSQEFSTIFTRFNLGINLGWMNFSHYSYISDDQLLSGASERFLNDTQDTTTNLDFRWNIADFDITLGAERRFNKTNSFQSETYTFRQLVTWSALGDTLWNLNVVESFSETDLLMTVLYSFELTANWQPRMNLQIRPTIGAWQRLDEGSAL
ncbi:MAG: hypothetical protein L3J79_13045, partial [Candidatus Marinimicrobia bacterium]|nr:hypothetical protein [Candidatus Neomarinimicrobiota bacterium]